MTDREIAQKLAEALRPFGEAQLIFADVRTVDDFRYVGNARFKTRPAETFSKAREALSAWEAHVKAAEEAERLRNLNLARSM